MKLRLDYNIKILIKGEFYAQLIDEKCNGCGICISRCQFGALNISVFDSKIYINQKKCFGCGLCATSCKKGAIVMKERRTNQILRTEL